jgi:DNA-binding PadR family transcriptional regulator
LTDHENFSSNLDALPLTESTFLILVCLEEDPKHGYAIMKEVETLSGGRVKLSTGTLFGAIKRLLGLGWIQRAEAAQEVADGRARKYYALTRRGRQVKEAETQRLRQLIAIADRRTAPGATANVD